MENQIPFSDFTVNGKRKLKIKFRFPTSQVNGKRKWRIKFRFPVSQENGKRKSKLFRFQKVVKKRKNENRSLNSIFNESNNCFIMHIPQQMFNVLFE